MEYSHAVYSSSVCTCTLPASSDQYTTVHRCTDVGWDLLEMSRRFMFLRVCDRACYFCFFNFFLFVLFFISFVSMTF